VFTQAVDGTGQYYLDALGTVTDLKYDDTMPGGSNALTCTLQADPRWRHVALNPGRRLLVAKGGSIQWEGRLAEPTPGDGGWALQGEGAGTWGSRFRAFYPTTGNPQQQNTPANVLGGAIQRGLRWVIGTVVPPGPNPYYAFDNASISITDYMNALASPAASTWRLTRTWAGLEVDLIPIPTTVTRLLITEVPATRTLAGYINSLYVKYMSRPDGGGYQAAFGLQNVSNPTNMAKHDVTEDFWDVSSPGVLTQAQASQVGSTAISKYLAASYAGPFVVQPGQYLTTGGSPVDLACENAAEVVQLVLADGPYGGEVAPAPPVTFPVGSVQYSDKDGTLTVTPFQSYRADWSTLLGLLMPRAPA